VGDAVPLHGEWKGCFRLRTGDYRMIFRPIPEGLEIIAMGHRSEIYR
jgi:mRNA-degrading endonuclease RelE of RelBE toxin-antitoxin system